MTNADTWPSLPFAEWRATCVTLHRWMQIVGKIRLKQAPPYAAAADCGGWNRAELEHPAAP